MAFILPCPPGDTVTCAILEVARALSDGPSAFTVWATLIVPIFAAAASTAVAVVSATIAKKARDIASDSEDARVAAESERVDREYEGRMHGAFIEVFGAIAGLAGDLQDFASYQEYARTANQYVPVEDRPRTPSDIKLLAEIASARLLAKNADEIELLNSIRELTLQSRSKELRVRSIVLAEVWPIVILWQNADETKRQELLDRFDELRGIESAEQTPSWVSVGAARV
ncbi:hypothetical protein [Arthrobacter sp. NPDC058192]|uniref:hypothetical protein n=1 Tax=Arthrobacter sp. NPDC058192 TaxID=3346372 RepID=UPI0036E1410A